MGICAKFMGLALLLTLNLRRVGIGRVVETLFVLANVVNIAFGIAILIGTDWVTDFLPKFYWSFYPDLIPNMVKLHKPVLTLGTHASASLFLYLFFWVNWESYRERRSNKTLLFAVSYIVFLFGLTSFSSLGFLGSPLALLLVPLVLERFLSSSPNHWGTAFHYSAPLAPILAMSAGDGLARLGRRIGTDATRARVLIGAAAACVLLSSLLPGHQPLWRLLSPKTYEAPATARTGDEALARIPAGASVVAQAAIVPHLSRRNLIYMLDAKAPDADFVVAAADLSPWPVARFADLAPLLEDRRRHGYTVVFDQDGWIVLRRAPN